MHSDLRSSLTCLLTFYENLNLSFLIVLFYTFLINSCKNVAQALQKFVSTLTEFIATVKMIACSSSHSILLTWLALPAAWAWPWNIARQRQLCLLDDSRPAASNYCHSDSGNNCVIIITKC